MELKTVTIEGKTYAEVQDGKPVYVADGREIAFDAPGTIATIGRLNAEAKGHRERAERAEAAIKNYEGITDPAAARKALEIVQSLDQKKLIDAGEVEKVKAEAIKAVEAQYAPIREKAEALEKQLRAEKIGGSFARSKFIAEKLAVPVPMVEKTFGDHFTIEDGRIVARDANGNQIYSRARPGELADFEEAIEMLIEAFPFRDSIMKGLGQTGSGARAGAATGGAGVKTISREAFSKMTPAEQYAAVMKDGYTVKD